MNANLTIRRAQVQDARLISLLSAITFSDTFSGTCSEEDMRNYLLDNYNEALITRELEDPRDFYFLASLDERPVAYMRIKEEDSEDPLLGKYRSLELKRIYVLKEYHAKRIGPAMMDYVLEFARHHQYEAIWLGVWEHNERAKAFYRKYGFRETGSAHPFPIGNTPQTDIWLYKLLAN